MTQSQLVGFDASLSGLYLGALVFLGTVFCTYQRALNSKSAKCIHAGGRVSIPIAKKYLDTYYTHMYKSNKIAV